MSLHTMSVVEFAPSGGGLPRLRNWAKTILWHIREICLVAVPVFLLLRYAGGFSIRQSAFVAAVAYILYLRFHVFSHLYLFRKAKFNPSGIHISFKWEEILKDAGRVFSDEQWREIWESAQSSPAHAHNVLRDGIRFNVLGPNLIYWMDRQLFMSRADFLVDVQKIGSIHVRQDWQCYLITVEQRRISPGVNKESWRGVFWIGQADKISLNQICGLEKIPLPAKEQIEEWDSSSHRAVVRQTGWKEENRSVNRLDQKYFSVELYSL